MMTLPNDDEPTDVEILNRFPELVGLTPMELRLWKVLWMEQGRPVSKDEIIANVWGTATSRVFDIGLNHLRRKLKTRDWDIAARPGLPGQVLYSLHPSVSSQDLTEEEGGS